MILNCLVVDDEPLAVEVLESYISGVSSLHLGGVFEDTVAAGNFLRENRADLIFLDINMPGLSGMEFLRSLHDPPMVIFTTAYPEYAVEGFEANAIDYLLKPFSLERFLKAVNKAFEKGRINRKVQGEPGLLWFRADKKLHKVNPDSIKYLRSIGDYVKICGSEGPILVHDTIRELSVQLEHFGIRRVHRSWSVALRKIEYIEGNAIFIAGEQIPIGRAYREEFFRMLNQDGKTRSE